LVNVLPIPFRSALAVVGPEGCLKDTTVQDCENSRGNTFDSKVSSSWHNVKKEEWDPSEAKPISPPRRGQNGSVHLEPGRQHPVTPGMANYLGLDSVSGMSQGKQWTIPDQGIMTMTEQSPFVGYMGLATNINGQAKTPTSLFDHVRGISNMKSVSWSYTAGNKASE
jgi:hypothetical protein